MFPPDDNEPRLLTWTRNPEVRQTLITTWRRGRRTSILVGLWLFLAVVLVWFRAVLLPFGLAFLLAFILDPAVDFLSRRPIAGRRFPRVVWVISIYVVAISFLAVFGAWAIAQIGRELAGLGQVTKTIVADVTALATNLLDAAERFAETNALPVDREAIEAVIQKNIRGFAAEVSQNATSIVSLGSNIVGVTFRAVFGSFLVLMLTAFISIDRARILKFFYSLVPPEVRGSYRTILKGMSVGLAGVVRGQAMICLANGVLTFIGLWLLDVKLPLILASIATVFSLIPIFGSILSTIPIVTMALTDSFAKGVFALLWIIGIHLVEANFLNPKIMGDAAKIHPVIVVFVLIVGESTAGLIGALFAVPIAAVVITVFKFLHRRALANDAGTARSPSVYDGVPPTLDAALPSPETIPPEAPTPSAPQKPASK